MSFSHALLYIFCFVFLYLSFFLDCGRFLTFLLIFIFLSIFIASCYFFFFFFLCKSNHLYYSYLIIINYLLLYFYFFFIKYESPPVPGFSILNLLSEQKSLSSTFLSLSICLDGYLSIYRSKLSLSLYLSLPLHLSISLFIYVLSIYSFIYLQCFLSYLAVFEIKVYGLLRHVSLILF